jgi:transcription-repair coupling factor (superfamily II helicase)
MRRLRLQWPASGLRRFPHWRSGKPPRAARHRCLGCGAKGRASGCLCRSSDRIDRWGHAGWRGARLRLEAQGYWRDDRVDEPGEIAIRAGTLDIFPGDAELPIRLHLDGETVTEIGTYDPVTQLGSGEPMQRVVIYPAAEPLPGTDGVSLFDHLPGASVALDPEAEHQRDRFIELAREAGGKAELVADWTTLLDGRDHIVLAAGAEQTGRRFVEARNPERAFAKLFDAAREEGKKVLVAGSARDLRLCLSRLEKRTGQAPQMIADWAEVKAAPAGAVLTVNAEIERGWSEDGLLVVATADLLGARSADTSRATPLDPLASELTDFHLGDALIHEDHGLALLQGTETVAADGSERDAIRLEHAGGTQRLVPVEEAARLWRYGGDADAVTLDKLDGSSWHKRRAEIDLAIAETARQLVALAEERAGRTAPVLQPEVADYEKFSAGFPFNETLDQARAIEAVRADLASGKPMDRLVVGRRRLRQNRSRDAGGRHRRLVRQAGCHSGANHGAGPAASGRVRQALRQVRDQGCRAVAPVDCRRGARSEAGIVGRIGADRGRHQGGGRERRRLQDLGLVIIDEEQRFGTADKRKLRELAADIHVLTLTATPIPRTLQGALVGLQDLSLITTPPARRLPTRTSVAGFAPDLVRPALIREQRRGGQSFVVVPRIEDMAPMAERLRQLVPDLKLRQAHGKLPAAEIDEAMVRFAAGDGDILLATNIIEAGLDIPRANTMLIWRADRFGLAQLHQLRGRVGRGRQRGTLLLLTEPDAQVAPATMKRLRTLEALDRLGAGFAISARDLDLRGAGNCSATNRPAM